MKFTNSHMLIGLVLFHVACSSGPKQDDYDDEAKKTTVTSAGGGGSSKTETFSIPVGVDYGYFALTGTAATAYDVNLADCLSGYSGAVDETNVDGVEVYKDDRDCLAKLVSFETNGITYTSSNPGATDFTTWLANDTAIFTSAGGDLIRVKVISQLDSPISGTEAVVYNFSELLDGTGDYVFSEAEVSDAHSITVESQEAPHFDVVAATYEGMDDATGAAEFSFKLECVDDPTSATPTSIAMSAGSAANSLCSANDLADVEYKLVLDTFASVLTIDDAETIFATAGTGVTMPADQYADSATNEGFNTTILDGPGALGTAGNENMILIVKAGLSYTYYNIDVTTISQ